MTEKSEILEKRQKKVNDLKEKINLFPNHFKVENTVQEIQDKIVPLEEDGSGDDHPEIAVDGHAEGALATSPYPAPQLV